MRGRPNDAKGLDFIVIGAQRAGTTSLFEHLREHPELYLPPGKERSFFSHDETYAAGWPKFAGDTYGAGPRGALWGKATPAYMYGCPLRGDGEKLDKPQRTGPTERIIPERIHSLFPDIKLIAILRDPVERCVSNYRKHALDRPWFPPFERIIATLLTPDSLERSRRMGGPPFVTLGEYGRILEGYYATFPREQIFVCFTSDLEAAPLRLMQEMHGFLGVDRGFVAANLGTRYLQGAASRRIERLRSPSRLQKELIGKPGVGLLWRLVPASAQQRVILALREVNYRFELWNRRGGVFDRFEASPETLARLRAHYEEDRVLLESLIRQPVPWPSAEARTSPEAADAPRA